MILVRDTGIEPGTQNGVYIENIHVNNGQSGKDVADDIAFRQILELRGGACRRRGLPHLREVCVLSMSRADGARKAAPIPCPHFAHSYR